MRAIVLLIDTISGHISNSTGAPLMITILTGIHEIHADANTLQVFPNPLAAEAIVFFSLPESENVYVFMSGLLGETVSILDAGTKSAGNHALVLDGKNMTPGLYFITLKTGNHSVTKKILLNK